MFGAAIRKPASGVKGLLVGEPDNRSDGLVGLLRQANTPGSETGVSFNDRLGVLAAALQNEGFAEAREGIAQKEQDAALRNRLSPEQQEVAKLIGMDAFRALEARRHDPQFQLQQQQREDTLHQQALDNVFRRDRLRQTSENTDRSFNLQRERFDLDRRNADRDFDLAQQTLAAKTANAKPTPAVQALDREYVKEYVDWRGPGAAKATSNIAKLEVVKNDLLAGKENLTGPVVSALPDRLTPQGTQARETVESVVQQSLREILGGQFAQQEGKELIKRSFNPRLDERSNAQRLSRLIAQLKAAAEARESQAKYYEENGSLAGWSGRIPTIEEMTASIEEEGGPPQAAIEFLKSNPQHAVKFDEKYGSGSAQRVLGGD